MIWLMNDGDNIYSLIRPVFYHMCLHVLMCLNINFHSNVLLYHLAIARLGTPNGTGSMRATTAGPSTDKSIIM